MNRIAVQLRTLCQLHHMAQIHNADSRTDMLYDGQIVGDKKISEFSCLLQFLQHIDDLCLDGNIQRRYRFVADDEARIYRQRPGDADTLSLSAGKLMRETVLELRVQSHQLHELQNLIPPLFLRLTKLLDIHGLADDV